jgi:hypothetical protein
MSLAQQNRLQGQQLMELRGVAHAVNTHGERVVSILQQNQAVATSQYQQLQGSLVAVGEQLRGAIDDTNIRINDLTTAMNTTALDILTRLSEIRDAQTAANEIKSLLKGIYKQIWDGLEYMLHLLYLLHLWWWTLRDPAFSVIPSAISSWIPLYIIIISIAWSVLEYILFCYVIVDIFILLITTGLHYIAGTPVIDWIGGFLMTIGWAITCIVLKGLFKFATIIGWDNPIIKAVISILQSICEFFLNIPIVGHIIGCLSNILKLIKTGWEAWTKNPNITDWMNMLFTYIGTLIYTNMPSMGLWGGKSSSKNALHKNKLSEEGLKDSIDKINNELKKIKKQIENNSFESEFLKENPNFKVSTGKASVSRVNSRLSKSSSFMFEELIRQFESIKPQFTETSESMTKYSEKMDIKTIKYLLKAFNMLILSMQKTGKYIFTHIEEKYKKSTSKKTKSKKTKSKKTKSKKTKSNTDDKIFKPRNKTTRNYNKGLHHHLIVEDFSATPSQ